MSDAPPGLILILEPSLAPPKRNRIRKRLEELGCEVRYIDGGAHPYLEVSGEVLPVRTISVESWPGVVRMVPLSRAYPQVAWGSGRGDFVAPSVVHLPGVGDADPPVSIGAGSFTVLAGPCAVEDAERTVRLATIAKESGATVFRAGAFKPRTSPYAFQGLEGDGLSILREVRAEVGIPIVTEVLDPRHLEMVADVADVLQVGSRNMHNYALLKELGACRHPILLKRGFASSYDEFLLAAEYILSRGNDRVVLCERGVRTTSGTVLDLGAVPELRRRSHLPIVVDPSHGSGSAHRVLPLARAAAAVGADGLLIEIHDDPIAALSDGQQAIAPSALAGLIDDCRAIRNMIESSTTELNPIPSDSSARKD